MDLLSIALIVSTLLCSLVAGFLFSFAVVVMPGINRLSDREFIRAFQAMDGIIQNNQPIFMLVWIGSVLALVTAATLGFSYLEGWPSWLLIVAAVGYLLGVQLPTFTINVPLNNRLQSLAVDASDDSALAVSREVFEGLWNRWNIIRTVIACLVSLLLIVVVFGS